MFANVSQDGKLDHTGTSDELRRFLDATLGAAGFDLRYGIEWLEPASSQELETPEVVVAFEGPDCDLLLERGAELLKALEYIAVRWLRLDPRLHDRVRFDCGNYRASRLAELKLSAQVAAQRVRETHLPFRFNPMTPRERRVLHLVLKDQRGVRSSSEGLGDDRRVVLFPSEAN
jgi:spoIIIJ-associated protein